MVSTSNASASSSVRALPLGPTRLSTSLHFVNSAVGDDCHLLGPPALAPDVGDLVQGLDAVDDVSKYPGELGVHVCQDYAKLRRNLKGESIVFQMPLKHHVPHENPMYPV